MAWTPIVSRDEALGKQAWEAVLAIAEDVVERGAEAPDADTHRFEESLLYGYLARALADDRWWELASDRLNRAIDDAPAIKRLSLYGGLAGLGWAIEHVSGLFDGADDQDLNDDVDRAILKHLERTPWRASYDLISGLAGIGLYFLERLPSEAAARGLGLVMDHLETLAEHHDDGRMTWFTRPELLPAWQRALHPEGHYDLGAAHGVPGVLALLNEIDAAGIEQSRVARLLEGAMRWLLAQQRATGGASHFGGWLASDGTTSETGLAWCYGDLGILAILRRITSRLDRDDWERAVTELLDHSLARHAEAGGIADAMLCHGAVGIAHVFNRLYQQDADPRCREAARAWIGRTLDLRRPGAGIGGFHAITKDDPLSPAAFIASTRFLDGALGLALALLAAITPIEPQWDRMLLLSGRS